MESAAKGERAVDHQEIRRRLAELDRAVDNDETKLDKTLRLQRLVRGYLGLAELHECAGERERAGLSESAVTPERAEVCECAELVERAETGESAMTTERAASSESADP
jgi:hypothetical protein